MKVRVLLSTVVLTIGLLLGVASASLAAEHTVNISGLEFVPATLNIEVGDTVTWVNDGGIHNVISDDGTFNSGDPSSDLWVYSYTFHGGGSYDYSCVVHAQSGMTGTVNVAGLFGDSLESGDTVAWGESIGTRPNCTCYFSGDCAGGTFCDYGPGGFGTEDICSWMDVKPESVPGAGCNIEHIGPWGGDICDGVCGDAAAGSALGGEPRALLAEGIDLWADAIIGPSAEGGGPVDPVLAQRAMNLEFDDAESSMRLARQVADILIYAGGQPFYEHFCHWEQYPDQPNPALWVDLSETPCHTQILQVVSGALAAEVRKPGNSAGQIAAIPSLCPNWRQLMADGCTDGDDPIACLQNRIADAAVFLTTERVYSPTLAEILARSAD